MRSKASATLAALLRPVEPPRATPTSLARELDLPPQAIHAWLAGDYKPKLEMMLELEKRLGIPVRDWIEKVPDETADTEPSGAA